MVVCMATRKPFVLSAKKFIQVFKESTENNQRFCFILGSGASVESGIPSGGILEMDWMDCLMGKRSDRGTAPMDPEESESIAEELLNKGDISHQFGEIKANWEEAKEKGFRSMSSEFYFDLFKLRFHPVQQNGYRYLESLMQKVEPSPGYRALALLLTEGHQHNLVITTNFDNLVEDALFLHTEWRPLVISHEALAEYIQFNTKRPIIVKVHRGLMYNPFNSPETTDHLEKAWHDALDYAFKTYTPVVVGYGGGDGSLMSFLKKTAFPNGIYWCYREASGEPAPEITEFLAEKGGCLVKTDGFDALMYSIGGTLYTEKVGIKETRAHLEAQCRMRTSTYSEKWTELEKQAAAKDAAKVVKAAEKESEGERAEQDRLTYWDHFDLAYAAYVKGDYDTAIQEYSLAIKKDPNRPTAYNNRGSRYYDLKQYERAIQDYDKAIELEPNYAAAYYNRGISYRSLSQYERAILDYDRAIELEPNDASAYYNRGNCYYDLKQYERAIPDYNKAIELDPNYALAYYNRDNSYRKLKQYDRSIQDFDKAIELDPNDADAYLNRGNAYHKLKDHKRAIQDFDKAIKLDSKYTIAYNNRGNCYSDQGLYKQAILDYNKAIELNPDYALAYNCRAFTYAHIEEFDKAISDIEKSLSLNPDEPNALHTYGFIHLQQKHYEEAIDYFSKALSFDNELKDAYEDRAKAYRALEKFDLAEADEAKAAELEAKQNKKDNP